MAASIPSGTVTFLFTDIEGSASLAQLDPARWKAARLEGWEMTLEQSIEYALQSG